MSTSSIKEKKALLDILKLVATGIKRDQQYGTFSNRVRALSSHGVLRGVQFDPEATESNSHSEYFKMLTKYIEENTDDEETEQVSKILNNWDGGSKLSYVRQKLRIADPKSERCFRIVVLRKSAQQMYNDLGYASLYISRGNEFTVVFNRDHRKADSLEHEYAHSQSVGGVIVLVSKTSF